MNDPEKFEKLERANAQIDVWIDEEEYNNVVSSCQIDKELQAELESAFSDEACTDSKDSEWLFLLNHENCPLSAVRNIPEKGDQIDLGSPDYKAWSHFFWAKLIRAKIQQKGTDCYYRRLDEVVAYLERHLPPIKPVEQPETNEQQSNFLSNMLAVIYLLEMAASGEGVDQRSFAERARRILRDKFKKDKPIYDFYDLLARYNIGVGHYHEHSFRKAVLEFNWIISKLENIWGKDGNFNPCSDESGSFVHKRFGRELLYLPAVLYRADIQLKLQLAYHTFDTIHKHLTALSDYKEARKYLVHAEAYQQMGKRKKAWEALGQTCQKVRVVLGDRSQVTIISAQNGEKFPNIKGRLQNLLAAEYLEYLKEIGWKMANEEELKKYFEDLKNFFESYKKSARYQKSDRIGYFEQVAEYLACFTQEAKKKDEEASMIEREAEAIYQNNKHDLFAEEKENTDYSCPCKEKGIDLRRLDSQHYNVFCENMRKFFRTVLELVPDNKKDTFAADQKKFLERLTNLEEKARYNLNWRKRDLNLETEKPPRKWCRDCIPNIGYFFNSYFSKRKIAFGGLLTCAGSSTKNPDNSLCAKDYELIMNHWDNDFLQQIKDPSFHEPRCRAIHFLGLQRWNSTSPAQGRSLGGGYLIYYTGEKVGKKGRVDLGVAVDPGFDFVRNLFHAGFSLADIDVVLLSHAHVDHVRDFESMITLLLELRKREKIQRKLHTILTLGVYRRLEYLIESPDLREFVEPYIVDIEKEIEPELLGKFKFIPDLDEAQNDRDQRPQFVPVLPTEGGNAQLCLEITSTKAYHNDFSEYSDSFGFVIKIKDSITNPEISYTLGYTGDTSWNQDIMGQYKDCDALLVHLGSLIDRENGSRREFNYYKNAEKCFELICEKNHPYLMGMLHFLTEINGWNKKTLVLMSEFGEEMRGKIRLDFIERLRLAYSKEFKVLPVDVGLDVLLAKGSSKEDNRPPPETAKNGPKVFCVKCEDFVSLDNAKFETYGHDEALLCVCSTCKKSTPHNVLEERLRSLYEVGWRLQTR